MALTLTLNGQKRSFELAGARANLAGLVADLGFKEDRIALELNGEIVSRAVWAATPIIDGDRLEMVHFVGGGADAAPEVKSSLCKLPPPPGTTALVHMPD